ncbi:MAG: NUDIX domain-containing protein [Candidatus Paceibacterota bacterium]|jgi:ADP-ribose pyrophosphatase YjhB (NUDIX family)
MKQGVDYPGVAVCYFCHDGKGNFVLSKRGKNSRDEHGSWDPGGGGVEFGDTLLETLNREIKEEYSAEILKYEFLGYREVFREQSGQKTHWLVFDFKVLVDRTEVKNGEPHKLDAVEWFNLDTLPSPLHSQFPNFIKLYKDKI